MYIIMYYRIINLSDECMLQNSLAVSKISLRRKRKGKDEARRVNKQLAK